MAGVDVNYRRLEILTQLMNYQTNWAKDIKDILMQLLDFEKEKDEINLIHRKDIKSLLNCSDITVAKMFNRENFPTIMIGEHKVEKSALKKWLQERRV